MKKSGGIYVIENLINHKKYIGQGKNVVKRMMCKHSENYALYSAIKKYGEHNLKRKILLYCEENELDYYEIKCISVFNSHVSKWGYNISYGGAAFGKGRVVPLEERENTRKRQTGKNNSFYGKTHSEETRKRWKTERAGRGNPRYGKPCSEETRKKISSANLGKPSSLKGISLPEKTKKLIRDARKGTLVIQKKKRKNAYTSQYFGVCKTVSSDKYKYIYWRARTTVNGKTIWLGDYKDEISAAKKRDEYIIENGLTGYSLNFPQETCSEKCRIQSIDKFHILW